MKKENKAAAFSGSSEETVVLANGGFELPTQIAAGAFLKRATLPSSLISTWWCLIGELDTRHALHYDTRNN